MNGSVFYLRLVYEWDGDPGTPVAGLYDGKLPPLGPRMAIKAFKSLNR